MKIAYCLPSLYIAGGMERVLSIKANYFAEVMKYEVVIILTDGKNKVPFYNLSPKVKIEQLDIDFEELWNEPFYKKAFVYLKKQRIYRKRLEKCLMTLKPDITISMLRREVNFINKIKDNSIKVGEIHINKSNFRKTKIVIGNYFISFILNKLWMWQLNKKLIRLNKFIILTNEDLLNWDYLQNTKVIPNPLSFFPSQISACNQKKVIAVGRYDYQKGYDLLLQAWQKIEKQHHDWVLQIYGSGERNEYQSLIHKYKLENVYLKEASNEIYDKFLESSIFVLSSRFEGFGLVITEAMSCGVPPVSFACPCGPKDIIKDGEDGLLVENGNIEQLAEKICYLIENEDVRKEMGRKARMNVERFKIENIAKQWDDLFKELLSQKEKH